jgi:hypothetical protein
MGRNNDCTVYLGNIFTTNEGYEIEIIEYINSRNITIKFLTNKENILKTELKEIKKGCIKNPYHNSVYEVGYFGVGLYNSNIKAYPIWYNMLSRCYSKKQQTKRPSYKGCTVAEEWHNFQVFAKWYEDNCVEDYHLDKDILIKGNKIYSPETCCFVPQEVNSLFTNSKRGNLPIGVRKNNKNFIAQISTKEGRITTSVFTTPEEAFQAYKTTKEAYIKEVADKWKDKIGSRVYQAMYNYQVEITD